MSERPVQDPSIMGYMDGRPTAGGRTETDLPTNPPYPPPPWELYGDAQVYLLLCRQDRLERVPAGFDPLNIAGFTPVLAGFINYTNGSVLRYAELYVAVVGRVAGRRRPTATVTHMWVDSEASRRGGRELWGYPKELARFELAISPNGTARAYDGRGELATAKLGPTVPLPVRITTLGGTVQPLGGKLQPVRAQMSGRPVFGLGRFQPGEGGPLGFLAGARLLLCAGLKDFHFRFGI
jgi:hypothetical protein